MNGPFRNGLLHRFDPKTIARLELRRVELPAKHEIEIPGRRVDELVFLEDGVASMTTCFHDGGGAEIALAGIESVLGTSALPGFKKSPNRVFMRVAGYGYATQTPMAQEEFNRCGVFQDLILHCNQALFVQAAQTAACNSRHSTQQRLSRWLLLCADRNVDRILPFSHDDLAEMIGARRSTVTVVAGKLKRLGVIEYTRSKIKILDRPGLERISCECYATVRDHLQ
ncbi:hypothetical protein HDF16_005812 [Granulicella aggregans]|uniref:HTH crp-type domain-containing protein n=1 Tax=Granulicella aggregans TaxID=474949 RepID=A0A7W7ZKW1_9BACT|nr:Crp/Fnr family transcriptional regulator [Granulicella aggregans]MBB5061076.1 hypothetical protein [Granulicella aggregans]